MYIYIYIYTMFVFVPYNKTSSHLGKQRCQVRSLSRALSCVFTRHHVVEVKWRSVCSTRISTTQPRVWIGPTQNCLNIGIRLAVVRHGYLNTRPVLVAALLINYTDLPVVGIPLRPTDNRRNYRRMRWTRKG